MSRIVAVLLGLLLAWPAFGQQVPNPMSKDGVNATLPAARENLDLGTVQSLGGNPPEAVTRFWTWDKTHPQFEVLNAPNGNEWVAMQPGQTGAGAVHLCTGFSPDVRCNYVALGTAGHKFGNGFGTILDLQKTASPAGSIKSYLTLWGGTDDTARLDVTSSYYAAAHWQAKAKGAGTVILRNDVGKLGVFQSTGGAVPDAYLAFTGGNDGTTRVTASSDTHANVEMETISKGDGMITLKNGHGTLGEFASLGAGGSKIWLRLHGNDGTLGILQARSTTVPNAGLFLGAQGDGSVTLANTNGNLAVFNAASGIQSSFVFTNGTDPGAPAEIHSTAGATQMFGHQFVMSTKTANANVTVQDSGGHFDNSGATGTVVLSLPTASRNLNYCFTVDAAFILRVQAVGTDKIAVGATNSIATGWIQSAAPYASICLKSLKAGQWVAFSTPDKAQWTVN